MIADITIATAITMTIKIPERTAIKELSELEDAVYILKEIVSIYHVVQLNTFYALYPSIYILRHAEQTNCNHKFKISKAPQAKCMTWHQLIDKHFQHENLKETGEF